MSDNHATLHWDPSIGFELDLDLTTDEVVVRMVRVPVPADGLLRLSEPVALFSLDTLFKTQVDVDGAPGQLIGAKVSVRGHKLVLSAMVEDAETGETRDLEEAVAVSVAPQAPPSGGPVPEEPAEDDLDWEDETTIDRLFDGSPEPTHSRRDDDDDFDDFDDEPPKAQEKPAETEKGLAALLKALMATESPAPERQAAPQVAPVEAPAPRAEPGLMNANDEAMSFLTLLVDQGHLELEEDAELRDLVAGTRDILKLPVSAERKATNLASWLLDQEGVEELYIDDESLSELIDQW